MVLSLFVNLSECFEVFRFQVHAILSDITVKKPKPSETLYAYNIIVRTSREQRAQGAIFHTK